MGKQIIGYMAFAHGAFNMAVALFFLYHGWTGLKIRRGRTAGTPDFNAIKGHRKRGPLLALAGIGGFLFGPALTYIDAGRIIMFPAHLMIGTLIALLLITTFAISRKIKAGPSWRTPHFVLGLLILCLYIIQVLVGMDVLF
jgi:hypothetical protein